MSLRLQMMVAVLEEAKAINRRKRADEHFRKGLEKLGLTPCVHEGDDPQGCVCRDNCVCRYEVCEHKPRVVSRFKLIDQD